jgi:trimeric autotransporter adhesin
LDVTDNSGGSPGAVQSIQLTGTGTAPAPVVNVSPLSLAFGSQAVGTASGSQIVSLSNVGSTALTISSVTLSGGDAANFGVAPSGSSPCPMSGGTIAIGAGCSVAVDFAPMTAGAKSATLSFIDDAGDSPQTVALSGSGLAPAAQLSPSNLNFGTQTVGLQSAALTVALADTGTAPLAVNGITITGPNAGDFKETDNCPPSLAITAACVISVTITPTAAGNRAASLSVADNAPGSPQVVSLTAVAAQAAVSLSPTTINFGNQLVGAKSQPVSVQVSDSGSGRLAISKISFSGGNAGDFSETDNCSAAIGPAGICTIQVTFAPICASIPNARSATMNLADNATGTPQMIPLNGTAAGSVCIDPPPGGLSQSISPGQTATFPLTLISIGGYAGQATLTCSGAPVGYSCSLPSPMTISAGAAASFQAVVAPTMQSMGPADGARSRRADGATEWPLRRSNIFIGACVALAAIWMERRKGWSRFSFAGAAVGILVVVCAACSGSGTTPSGNSGTPQSTSVLSLSASAGGTTTTLTLTLTVN